MRIVQLVTNLNIGGLERLAVDLARCQKEAGHDARIYCLGEKGAFADQAEAAGIPVTAFNKGPGVSPRTVWQIAKQLKIDQPDVLHGHNHLIHHYAVTAARMAGVPVVVNTRHNEDVQILEKPDGTGFYRSDESPDRKAALIYRAAVQWSDAIIFISENARQFYIRNRGIASAGTYVILNGAPLEPFLARPARPGSQRPRFRFGTAGRMAPVKDHLTMVDAFAIVARELPEAELHFAGGGPMKDRIEKRIADLDLGGRVILRGPLFDMPAFLSELDCFVLSSLSEGLPMVILEAMATGLPIVSTRVGGVPEAAPEGSVARYAPISDAAALARAMIETARDPNLDSVSESARRLAQTRFTIEHAWKEHEKLFESLRKSVAAKAA